MAAAISACCGDARQSRRGDGASIWANPEAEHTEEEVCERWQSVRADLTEGNWTGSVAACDAGDIDAAARNRVLALTNFYRWLAGLPAVTHSTGKDADAQACALMMHANNTLSHTPPPSWTCYSEAGDEGAGTSNIATTPAVMAVDLYMVDTGNETTMGHRRWILSNGLGPIGIGSTDEFSCMLVIGGSGTGDNRWTSFPPPGPFPFEAVAPLGWESIDEGGWTIQSDDIDLDGASVDVTVAGTNMPVSTMTLDAWYGSATAVSFLPLGWSTTAGTTYEVAVAGASEPIAYEVEIVDCD